MAKTLRTVHPDPDIHKSALFDLMGKSFGNYWGSLEYCRNGYIDGSHYNWRTSRIGLTEDEIVSHFGVWDYQMRIGMDTIRTGGIGAVMTDRRYRKRGFMKETAEASCAAMEQEGYGLSVLFGIPDFYQKFGYVSAWDNSIVTINERDLPAPAAKLKLRRADYPAGESLGALSNRTNVGLTGTAVRPTFETNRHPDSWLCFRWQSLSSAGDGYVIIEYEDHACKLIDCAGRAADILLACTQLVRRRGCAELKIPDLHRNHRLFDALRQVPYKREEYNNPTGGAMIKMTNLPVCLTSIRKTLMRRLRESSFCDWTGSIHFQKDREPVVMIIDRRGISIQDGAQAKSWGTKDRIHRVRIGDAFGQFIIGLDDPNRLLERHGFKTTGDAKGLIGALFPEQFPSLGKWDQF